MRVLLLGGTGAMGQHLSGLLQARGFQTAVTSRSRTGSHDGVTYIKGDAHDGAFLEEILSEKWDCIVDFMVYSTREFASRVELMLSLASQYVFISTARVFAKSDSPIHEDSPRLLDASPDSDYLQTDEYALTKARQENLLRASRHDNWTIVRPYITYGDTRLQLGHLEKEQWLYRALAGRTVLFSQDISARLTTLTHGYDVARGIAALIGEPEALGQSFNITTSKSLKWEQVIDIYRSALEDLSDITPKFRLQSLGKTLSWCNNRKQVQYDRLYDRTFDNAKISKYVDTTDFSLPSEGLRLCLSNFLVAPRFLEIDWRQEALKDRMAGEYARLSELGSARKVVRYVYDRMKPSNINTAA